MRCQISGKGDNSTVIWRALSDDNARMLVHALICNRVDYCNSILHRVAAVHLCPFQSMLNAAAWLSESGSSTTLRRLCVTTFTGFLLTGESSSNYVCLCSNVDTRWHHHTWHRCAYSCRPKCHRQLWSEACNDLVIPRTRTASYGPRSFAVSGPTCWNSLPPQLKSASLTLQQFCDRLKTVLFFRSYAWALPSWICY